MQFYEGEKLKALRSVCLSQQSPMLRCTIGWETDYHFETRSRFLLTLLNLTGSSQDMRKCSSVNTVQLITRRVTFLVFGLTQRLQMFLQNFLNQQGRLKCFYFTSFYLSYLLLDLEVLRYSLLSVVELSGSSSIYFMMLIPLIKTLNINFVPCLNCWVILYQHL